MTIRKKSPRSLRGAALVEYSLLIGLIAVIVIAAAEGLGGLLQAQYIDAADSVSGGGGGITCEPPDPC